MTLFHSPGAMIATKMPTTMRACHETHPYPVSFFTYVAIFFPSSFGHATPPDDINKDKPIYLANLYSNMNVDDIINIVHEAHDDGHLVNK
jgi:hypothetical protein